MTTKATLVFGQEPVLLSIEPFETEKEDRSIPIATEKPKHPDLILRTQQEVKYHVRELERFGISLQGGKELGITDIGPVATNAATWKLFFDRCDAEGCELWELISRAAQAGIKRKI